MKIVKIKAEIGMKYNYLKKKKKTYLNTFFLI